MKKVELITDGACLGNPGPGGWAALLRYNAKEKLITGSENESTNNRMELRAIIEGLALLKESCAVTITSDSQYVINAFEKAWLTNWKKNGWKNSAKKPVANQELWQELDELVAKHKVDWIWVKGHNGHPDNERVDQAAREAALSI